MKKIMTTAALLMVLVLVFSGCSVAVNEAAQETDIVDNKSSEENEQISDTEQEVITVRVGTMGTYEPFTYVDEQGVLTGYDIEVLRLIEAVDTTLKFEFQTGPWDTMFPGLDADKFQLIANQITSNPDRIAKYLLTDNTYALCVSQLIVQKGRTDIQSLNDLQGKKIGTTVGDSFTRILEDWNEENGQILDIVYYEEDVTTLLQDIVNGRIDATLNDPIMAIAKAKAQGLEVEPVGDRVAAQATHFIFKNDEVGGLLKEKLDNALRQLKEDGRLSQLSVDWFGEDYSK